MQMGGVPEQSLLCWENMVQCSPFITLSRLCLGTKGMNHVISESCNKELIL